MSMQFPSVTERFEAARAAELGNQLMKSERSERVMIELRNAFAAGALWQYGRKAIPSGDQICQECGHQNPIWSTDNDLWNTAYGNEGGVLCPTCFALLHARVSGQSTIWRLVPIDRNSQDPGSDS